ncbi:MAG: molybdopterin molybdotransferase MoeA [Lachnospiraceae bacterium]|nr:molybdopterin molybdotransferase MoeA [Lachnospiraceae bacterium]
MVQLEEAQEVLKNTVHFIEETEKVVLSNAIGRVLAADAVAKVDQPPFPRSPLDGYAVRGSDTKGLTKEYPGTFRVIGKIYAGEVFEGIIERGEAVRIMTGAPIPDGADTVIRQEWTDYGEDEVRIYAESKPYQNYCCQGEDYKKGDILLKKGTVLDGISIAILASLGMKEAEVYRLPNIAVISTGDEVVQPGEPLKSGKIYDSNLHLLYGRLAEIGIRPYASVHSKDSAPHMAETIKSFVDQADLIITTGGVSVGEKDIMHEVAELLGAEKLFWRVDLKPGAPTLSMVFENTLIICLSGNPFGAAANFELLVRGVIGKLSGNPRWNMDKKKAVMQTGFPKKGGVRRFLRAYHEDGNVWLPAGKHVSGVFSSMIGCNCLVEVPEDKDGVMKGDSVWIHLL